MNFCIFLLLFFGVFWYTVGVATLYIVGTPIGNLGDITFRAIETLKSVDLIACEDTRHTMQLLTHFGIKKSLVSCRAQNEDFAASKVIAALDAGKNCAYASDAGTPGISDPGAVLVKKTRQSGHTVTPIPGVSALTALVSVAGGENSVTFAGFLSPKAGRRSSRLRELLQGEAAVVLYESPFRIVKLLAAIADIDSERRVVVARELTKLHEEIIEGSAHEMCVEFTARTRNCGEFSVFVSGKKHKRNADE
ncbi:MAG: 16S rRNA (cytidine(1402)-2'-O)-methyltransferase [Treponemataceae bacterium]|nr:MAG: 16S rRNA (cytidine(1402)-2'-O)-methyltransferase [Treponemataceae bacterium]